MGDNGYVKITFEDVKIAENFFENDKHLDEFLSQVCRYYIGFETTFKHKNVKKYFETYKKVMDRVIKSRSTGSIGGNKRVENQQLANKPLEGSLEVVVEGVLEDALDAKERKEKEIKEKEEIRDAVFDWFKKITNKNIKVFDSRALGYLNARLKDGYTVDDIKKAITNCYNDSYHKETKHKHLTLEFILRQDKLSKFSTVVESIEAFGLELSQKINWANPDNITQAQYDSLPPNSKQSYSQLLIQGKCKIL